MEKRKCFVCDCTVTKKAFVISSYKLKFSKKDIIQKIGLMIGEGFVVVCKNDDLICQSCATIMETIDKAEHDGNVAKRLIFNFLEKKYALDSNEFSQEPEEKIETQFVEQKRKSLDSLESLSKVAAEEKRRRVTLSCDTCHYSVGYNTFVQRHFPSRETSYCSICKGPMQDGICVGECNNCETIVEETQGDDLNLHDSLLTNPLPQSYLDGEANTNIGENLEGTEEDETDAPEAGQSVIRVMDISKLSNKGTREVFAVDGIHFMWDKEEKSEELL